MTFSRLRNELIAWRGVWQQLTTCMDRVDETADQDEPHIKMISALLPVFAVIERARKRATGKGLAPALDCGPRGVRLSGGKLPSVGKSVLLGTKSRLPGVEDMEIAACMLRGDDEDGTIDKDSAKALMFCTTTLFTFRDEKHGEVTFSVPAYDFGPLVEGNSVLFRLEGVVQDGLFPIDKRIKAAEEGSDEQILWSDLRKSRVNALPDDQNGEKQEALSTQLQPLHIWSGFDKLIAIGNLAKTARDDAKRDAKVLGDAAPVLTEVEAPDEAIDALTSAKEVLDRQSTDYQYVVDKLTPPHVYQLDEGTLAQVKSRLDRADHPSPGILGLPLELLTLDAAASSAMDDAVRVRLSYPDGSLRMLRLFEWTLRHQWAMRRRWFAIRLGLVLGPLYRKAIQVFVDSVHDLRVGNVGQAPLGTNSKVGREATTQATSVVLEPKRDLTKLRAGHMAYIEGDRPTVCLISGSEIRPATVGQASHQRLHVTPLNVSIATDLKLPGIAGLIKKGTRISAGPIPGGVKDHELRSGKSDAGANADAVPQELAAVGSKLALLLGVNGLGKQTTYATYGGIVEEIRLPGRPAAPYIAPPFPNIDKFAVEEPVEVGATRLFLKSVPPQSQSGTPGSKNVMMARPGELMLIRGKDGDGQWWQSVIEVARVDILTGAAARKDDEVTGTPTPACCQDDTPVVVITLRDMQITHDLMSNISVSRAFDGFGAASLAAREVLPETLDPETKTIHEDGKVVLRDPELRAALRILDQWLQG